MQGIIVVLLVGACATDSPVPVPPPPVPTPEMCPTGFGPMGEVPGCYGVTDDDTWKGAETLCKRFESLGVRAHLVVIDRDEEHQAFSIAARDGDIWVGRLQEGKHDEYRNINYIDYAPTYFGQGEPNDLGRDCSGLVCGDLEGAGDERCIEYKHETGLWNDEKCGRIDRVFCEWDNVEPYDWKPGADG